MQLVGVTGGIGAGKSTVCEIFSVLGISVYNADARAKYLMSHDEKLRDNIIAVFGKESYTGTQPNRDHLAKHVFTDTDQITKLNMLVHPAVAGDFSRWVAAQSGPYVIKEAALLIETGSYKGLDCLICVDLPVDVRVQRVAKRDPFRSEMEIREIIKKQTTDEKRREVADFLIDNSGSEMLIPQVLHIHRQLIG